ncbi:MAG TPA: ATP-binding protein [Candidatus Binatia bacterium]|jgi:ATP-dependent DNA helicase RecG
MSSISTEKISEEQAEKIRLVSEGQFSDVKSVLIPPSNLTKHISALADADGGDLYIGIAETTSGDRKIRTWEGFADAEAANGHLQIFEELFPLGTDFQYEFLSCDQRRGLVLHVQINKTRGIVKASNGIAYLRRGAQSLPQKTPELIKRLEYAKGVATFESEVINVSKETVAESETIKKFIEQVVPSTTPEPWLKKQILLRDNKPTVAGAVLFSDEPQALIPKHCGVKIYRYRTKEAEGFREVLEFTPKTVEGCLYQQIKESVRLAIDIVERIPKMGDKSLEKISYPPQTLHEIITNALIHRDYSIADDVHIRIFDDRIEVQSPGRLPAHVTVKNILEERFARNGQITRILNKFPDPPN